MANWTRSAGTEGPWASAGNSCVPAARAADGTAVVVLPAVTIEDVARLGLPPARATLEPGTGNVVLNVPVNVFADTGPVVRETELLGFPVTIRATPVSFTWSFGDGAVLGPTADPGAPWPAMTTTHTYTTPGTYEVALTTTWTATASVAGLPPEPVPGTVDVATAAGTLTARAGTTVLTR